MFNQHAKWFEGHAHRSVAPSDRVAQLPADLAVWRQDQNGFSHQDPGFIDHVVNKKSEVVRVVPAARRNTLLVGDRHACASSNTST